MRHIICLLLKPWVILSRGLHREDLLPDPIQQFELWYKHIRRLFWLEFPDAMCLSTLSDDGLPDGRMVLLKHVDAGGFVFYTNSNSCKGRALAQHPKAALTFYWDSLQRQVRVQGKVVEVSEAESDQYFKTRPRRSQLGAWASAQSEVLISRSELDRRVAEFDTKFKGQLVPRPPYWKGYRVVPFRIEFWKLRLNRLHDRFVYTRQADSNWKIERLYP